AGLLDWCGREGVALVPFGGGTSVVGGLAPDAGGHRAVLSIDLVHFDALESVDAVSGEAVLGAGLTGPRAEELLAEQGFSLGHFPQSFPYASIGGYAMTRSSGQSSAGYGRFDEMVRGLTVVTPVGVIESSRAPASAAGPDLRQWLMGSEGAFGVCTRVRVRVHPVPETVRHEAFRFPDFATGAAALRAVEQQGTGPTVLRLSDETETMVHPALGTEETGAGGPARRGGAGPGSAGAREDAGASPGSRAPTTTRSRGRPSPVRSCSPAAGRRWGRGPPSRGSTAASVRQCCATRCWTTGHWSRRWRRRPTGPTSPHSRRPSRAR